MMAPRLSKLVRSTPGGIKQTITLAQTVTLDDPANLFSVLTLSNVRNENGHTWKRLYDSATRTVTATSPAGRQEKLLYDANGELVRAEVATGTDPLLFTYDARGRVTSMKRGTQSQTYAYDSANRLVSRTDALGNITRLAYDAADRPTALTLPSGNTYRYTYDANGDQTSITMPNGRVHALSYDALGRGVGYTPAGGGTAYARSFNADSRPTRFGLPSGRSLDVLRHRRPADGTGRQERRRGRRADDARLRRRDCAREHGCACRHRDVQCDADRALVRRIDRRGRRRDERHGLRLQREADIRLGTTTSCSSRRPWPAAPTPP